jgi:hypothetical protein
MLYTITILISGVYMNQEYPEYFPSIKILIGNVIFYLKNLREPIQDNSIKDNFINNIQTFFNYFRQR